MLVDHYEVCPVLSNQNDGEEAKVPEIQNQQNDNENVDDIRDQMSRLQAALGSQPIESSQMSTVSNQNQQKVG